MALTIARDPASSRRTAILLLIIAIVMVYLLGFHWFVLRHLDYGEQITDLSAQLARFQSVAAQREVVEERLEALQNRRSEANLFLQEADFNEAAAGMSERLNQMVSNQAEGSCQIVSRQPVRARVVERFEKVTVNVRMRCNIEDLMRVLYSLETGVPMIIAEELTVIKPRVRRRSRNQPVEVETALDIRFNMSGYLRSEGAS